MSASRQRKAGQPRRRSRRKQHVRLRLHLGHKRSFLSFRKGTSTMNMERLKNWGSVHHNPNQMVEKYISIWRSAASRFK